MNISVIRSKKTQYGTFGIFYINDDPLCLTLEDPWNNNKTGISCIPEGVYKVSKHSGLKYKNVWILHDVPDRTAILIHSGNTINDTRGCILVGNSFGKIKGMPAILDSQSTLNMLRAVLPDDFVLTIL